VEPFTSVLSPLPFLLFESLNFRPKRSEPGIDLLVPPLDLANVVNSTGAFGGQGGEQHGHAGANVGRLHRATTELGRTRHYEAMGIAEDDTGTPSHEFVHKRQA